MVTINPANKSELHNTHLTTNSKGSALAVYQRENNPVCPAKPHGPAASVSICAAAFEKFLESKSTQGASQTNEGHDSSLDPAIAPPSTNKDHPFNSATHTSPPERDRVALDYYNMMGYRCISDNQACSLEKAKSKCIQEEEKTKFFIPIGVTSESRRLTESRLAHFAQTNTNDKLEKIISMVTKDLECVDQEIDLVGEIFNGAHLVITNDRGQFYEFIKENTEEIGAYARISSHYGKDHELYSEEPQLGLDLPSDLGHMLCGILKESNKVSSWFQLEAHGLSSLHGILNHGKDYILHKLTGNSQVGPSGFSEKSEKVAKEIKVRFRAEEC